MAISAYVLKIVEKDPFFTLQMKAKEMFNRLTKHNFKISFPRENEAIKHDLFEFKVQCLKVFCYHGNNCTILLFYSIFRTTPEVSNKLYFVEICQVSETLWLFNHNRADFWLPNFGFKRSLLRCTFQFFFGGRGGRVGGLGMCHPPYHPP